METQAQVPGAAPGKRPWAAYNIIERNDRRIWNRVGSAWRNGDGSFNILLDSFPLGGRIHIREDDREREGAPRRGQLATAAEEDPPAPEAA